MRDSEREKKEVLRGVILHYIAAIGSGSAKWGLGLRRRVVRGIREFSHLQTAERNEPCGHCVI